jgi:hypothetical protein
MTSDTGDKGAGSGANKPGRRPPTIDLKATELASDPVANARAPSDEADSTPNVEGASSTGTQTQTEAQAGEAPPHDEQPRRRPWNRFSGAVSWPLIGAGAVGVIGLLLLGAVLANMWAERDAAVDARFARLQSIDELSERVAKLEAALAVPPAPDPALMNRVAAAEAAAKQAAENTAALQRRTEELTRLVREARSRADAAAATADAAQKTAGAAAPDAAVALDVDAMMRRIAALEQALQTTQAELYRRAARAADDRMDRLAVVASVLLGAVERGAPFTAELAAAKALAGDAKSLSALDAFASSGVPSAAALTRELVAVIPAMLKAVEGPTPREGSFLDKLQASAERLVRIRPVGEPSGDRPLDIIARLEAKANASDLNGAVSELAKLPPQVRASADAWADKVKARDAALAAARQFSRDALVVIGKSNT